MPHDIARTELVWPGKYDEDGKRREVERVSLPFQVIERVNESRATREATKARGLTLFDFWEGDKAETFEDGWRNKLIWGENLLVMGGLLDQFAGKVDLVYIDPPFATGADFNVSALIGDDRDELPKEQSLIEEKAYRDTWGRGQASYLQTMSDRLHLLHELLRDGGSIYIHLDWRFVHDVKLVADDVFGRASFRNDITWKRAAILGRKATSGQYGRVTDTILYYTKGDSLTFNRPYTLRPVDVSKFNWDEEERKYFKTSPRGDYTDESIERLRQENRVYTTRTGGIRIKYFLEQDDQGRWCERMPTDCLWLDIPDMMHIPDAEKTGYDTQKPEALMRRIVEASSNPGDLVLDVFAGSGTTAVAAERSGRRWISCDLGRYATHITRKRLLGIDNCRPFEVLNLGRYERKYWQVATFGEDLDDDGLISLYEYVTFILKLYSASPAAGMQHLHGKKGRAFVHVGAVDSPVTIDEIAACIEECAALKAKELHVLGWEWEMGLHDPMEDQARARGVQLVLRQIPREVMEAQAAAKGDIEFFELAYLDVAVKPTRRKHEVVVLLNNFVIPNPELVPDEVREKIRKWSDYVDYWAVDWNFADDTFHQGWVTYRTRKDRSLALESDPHAYEEAGQYEVMVKVIDIFGNDTSKICSVKVS